MKLIFKIIAILIVVILVASSIYVAFYYNKEENNQKDATPPTIDSITGNTTGTTGKITTIVVSFSDNINVTEATIYYKSKNAQEWSNKSILSGSVDLEIPSDSDDDWYYYVTVNDAAGNGPVGSPSIDGSIYYTITVTNNAENLVHTVFIEEATATWCDNCPAVAEVLDKLYNSGEYNFYYVSMVDDQSDKAHSHLYNDYNLYGFPTVYIDGGYKVILGGGKQESVYTEAIKTAESRTIPPINLTVEVNYKENGSEFTTNVVVKNLGEESYSGKLKVYLTEIVSRWNDYSGSPYSYSFWDYIINKDVSVNAGGDYTTSENYSLTGLDPANLMVIGVVFNSKSEARDSNPDASKEEEKRPFDAHFADAADGTRVIAGGNLPPEVGITNPVKGKLHFFGIPLFKTLFKNTVLIGRTKITVNASDQDGTVEKVEFYIDGKLKSTAKTAPYEYTLTRIGLFKEIFFHKHTILVKAYDNEGKTSTDDIEVLARL